MLRLLHTADWHLGHSLAGFDREAEQRECVDQILQIAVDREIDALLLAGDVFHAANPPLAAQALLYRFIDQLRRRAPRARLIAIAGNHDSAGRLELPLALGLGEAVRLHGAVARKGGRPDPEPMLTPLLNAGGEAEAVLLCLPYPRPGDLVDLSGAAPGDRPVRAFLAEGAAAARAAWPGRPLIVMTHLHVAGGRASEESERRILIGGEEATPLSDFPPEAAYVALGHLHRPQTLTGAPTARYAGAPLPLATDEARHGQSVTLLTVDGGAVEITEIPLRRPRRFLRIPETGAAPLETLERLLKEAARRLEGDPEAAERAPFLEAVVALDGPEPELRRRVEQALGDAPALLTRIRRDSRPEADGPQEASLRETPRPPTPEEAFAALHQALYAAPASTELRDAFQELLSAVENEDAAVAADRAGAQGGADPQAPR